MQNVQLIAKNGDLLPVAAVEELKTSLKCEVVLKGEALEDTYRAAIDRFNQAVIEEASIVVFCESEDDIAATLKYVQRWSLDFVIACGRHSYYGASSTKGVVIDLGKMKRVTIDKESMSITAQGGCQAVDLETPLQAEGLSVVMGAANDTGIGGITLGGGSGYLTGQYGLVIDHLLAARVVIADGTVLECSEQKNADLFWGIRGGGSNFGVVTEFTYRIHNQGDVFFGPLVFTPDKTRKVLELIDEIQKIVDGENGKLAVFVVLLKGPDMPSVHPLVLVFYDGPEEEARRLIAPILALEPVANMAAMHKYADITKPSPLTLGPATHQNYSASNALMFSPLTVDVVEGMIERLNALFDKYGDGIAPSKIMLEVRSYGKSSSVASSATALAARRPAIATVFEAQYSADVSPSAMRAEVKSAMIKAKEAVKQEGLTKGGGGFVNANIADGTEKVADMFGENLPRLREIKRKYDPDFVFNKWYPISPVEV